MRIVVSPKKDGFPISIVSTAQAVVEWNFYHIEYSLQFSDTRREINVEGNPRRWTLPASRWRRTCRLREFQFYVIFVLATKRERNQCLALTLTGRSRRLCTIVFTEYVLFYWIFARRRIIEPPSSPTIFDDPLSAVSTHIRIGLSFPWIRFKDRPNSQNLTNVGHIFESVIDKVDFVGQKLNYHGWSWTLSV